MRAHELFALMAQNSEQHGMDLLLKKQAAINLSGFGQTVRDIAMKDVGGPKGILQPLQRIGQYGKAGTGRLQSVTPGPYAGMKRVGMQPRV